MNIDSSALLLAQVKLDSSVFLDRFALGFYLATIFTIIALYHLIRARGELSRFRRHLSDRLEIESDAMRKMKMDLENLKKENESLRVKVNALNEQPERKLQRDLEIYARAEKRMLINVPGFAPAWETAKTEAHNELAEEEAGRSAPKRLFTRLFGGGATAALPGRGDDSKTTVDSENGHKD